MMPFPACLLCSICLQFYKCESKGFPGTKLVIATKQSTFQRVKHTAHFLNTPPCGRVLSTSPAPLDCQERSSSLNNGHYTLGTLSHNHNGGKRCFSAAWPHCMQLLLTAMPTSQPLTSGHARTHLTLFSPEINK